MASSRLFRRILALWVWLSLLSTASAQNVAPTNASSTATKPPQFQLQTTQTMSQSTYKMYPLTADAGLSGTAQQLNAITIQGHLVLTTPKFMAIQAGDIAYISCDPGNYTGQFDVTKLINVAVSNLPAALVLYSDTFAQCSFNSTNGFAFSYIYTMLDANTSASLEKGLMVNSPPSPSSMIKLDQSSSSSGNEGDMLGKSPTTAVAMIILYSITGIITALFLIIIIVGALRAHRHPERYGPRHVLGRARQSRAKGIARAMLETLPIVKFGEWEDHKAVQAGRTVSQTRDVEQGTELGTLAGTEHVASSTGTEHQHTAEPADSQVVGGEGVEGRDLVITETAAGTTPKEGESDSGAIAENGLACSVCTDDFVKGQDIRVLPCNHKFHPECIDPWLLNVSGTCPLCRVDLRPTNSHTIDPENPDSPSDPHGPLPTFETAPHADPSTTPNRRSRTGLSLYLQHTLNIHRMRDATPAERIAALRRLRSQAGGEDGETAVEGGERRTRNRVSARLSRAFNHATRPPSTQSATGNASAAPAAQVPESDRRMAEL